MDVLEKKISQYETYYDTDSLRNKTKFKNKRNKNITSISIDPYNHSTKFLKKKKKINNIRQPL